MPTKECRLTEEQSCLDGVPKRSPPEVQTLLKQLLMGAIRLVPLGGIGVRVIRAFWRRASTPQEQLLARGVQIVVVATLGWISAFIVAWVGVVRPVMSFVLSFFGIDMDPHPSWSAISFLMFGVGVMALSVIDAHSINLDTDCRSPEVTNRMPRRNAAV